MGCLVDCADSKHLQDLLRVKVEELYEAGDVIFTAQRTDKMTDVWKGLNKHNIMSVPVSDDLYSVSFDELGRSHVDVVDAGSAKDREQVLRLCGCARHCPLPGEEVRCSRRQRYMEGPTDRVLLSPVPATV